MEKAIFVTYHKEKGEGYKVGICRKQQFIPSETEDQFFDSLVEAVHELPEVTTESMHMCYVPRKHCQYYWVALCEVHPKKTALRVARTMKTLAEHHFHENVEICQV